MCLLAYLNIPSLSLPASQQQTHHQNHNDGLQRGEKFIHAEYLQYSDTISHAYQIH